MLIKRFEDIETWQEARKLTIMVYKATGGTKFIKDWGLRDQIQRASVSVMNNIAEGFDSASKTEFRRFLSIARRSCSEVQSILYIALDLNYVDKDQFNELYEQAEKVRRMITSFMNYLRNAITRARSNSLTQ